MSYCAFTLLAFFATTKSTKEDGESLGNAVDGAINGLNEGPIKKWSDSHSLYLPASLFPGKGKELQ